MKRTQSVSVLVSSSLTKMMVAILLLFSGFALPPAIAPGAPYNEVAKLVASDAAAGDEFGSAVSMDGAVVVVGAPGDDDEGEGSGAAYVFEFVSGVWTESAKLTASDAAAEKRFGHFVSIDGDVIVVGAPGEYEGTIIGAAYVFTRSGGIWIESAKLTASDAEAGDWFGSSVSISGSVIAVASYKCDAALEGSGAAYVFERSGVAWPQTAKLIPPEAQSGDFYGYSVSVSDNVIVVGAFSDDRLAIAEGAVYVFEKINNGWQKTAKLIHQNAVWDEWLGYSVSIDGDFVASGGPWSNQTFFFERDGAQWTEVSTIENERLAGNSISVTGNTCVVGGPNADRGPDRQNGTAVVYKRFGNSWMTLMMLSPSDSADRNLFGCSVSASGDVLVVGANGNDVGGENAGAAYVFNADPTVQGLITVDAWQLDFGATEEQLPLTVLNIGDARSTLNYTIDVEWGNIFSITPAGGTSTGPSDRVTHTVAVDRSRVSAVRRVTSRLRITGNGLNSPVYVNLSAQNANLISASTQRIDFGASLSTMDFAVWNAGLEQRTRMDCWLRVIEGEAIARVEPSFVSSTGPDDRSTHTITIDRSRMFSGAIAGRLQIDGNAFNSPVDIEFSAVNVNAIATDIQQIDFGTSQDSADFSIWNAGLEGGSPMLYTVELMEGGELFSVNLTTGTSLGLSDPKTHSVIVDRSLLPSGTSTGTLRICANAGNSPVYVELSATNANTISTATRSIEFGSLMDSANFALWNVAEGSPMAYDIELLGGLDVFSVSPTWGVSSRPEERTTHTVTVNRDNITTGYQAVATLRVSSPYASNSPLEIALSAWRDGATTVGLPVKFIIAHEDRRVGVAYPFGLPLGYEERGAIRVGSGTEAYFGNDFERNPLVGVGWLGMFYREDETTPSVKFLISYEDRVGVPYPYGIPAGYEERGSIHVGSGTTEYFGTDHDGHPLIGGGWLAMFYRDGETSPPVIFGISYEDRVGAPYPYGIPAGYAERGSIHVGQGSAGYFAADYQERWIVGGGWLAMFYRYEDLARAPAASLFVAPAAPEPFGGRNAPAAIQESMSGEGATSSPFQVRVAGYGMPRAERGAFNLIAPERACLLRRIAAELTAEEDCPAIFEVYALDRESGAGRLIGRTGVARIARGAGLTRGRRMRIALERGGLYAVGLRWSGPARLGEAAVDEELVVGRTRTELGAAVEAELLPNAVFGRGWPIQLTFEE